MPDVVTDSRLGAGNLCGPFNICHSQLRRRGTQGRLFRSTHTAENDVVKSAEADAKHKAKRLTHSERRNSRGLRACRSYTMAQKSWSSLCLQHAASCVSPLHPLSLASWQPAGSDSCCLSRGSALLKGRKRRWDERQR
jgi:hypothetical protein